MRLKLVKALLKGGQFSKKSRQVEKARKRERIIDREVVRRKEMFEKARPVPGAKGVKKRMTIDNQLRTLDNVRKYSSKDYGSKVAADVASTKNVLKKRKKLKSWAKDYDAPPKRGLWNYERDFKGGVRGQVEKLARRYRVEDAKAKGARHLKRVK